VAITAHNHGFAVDAPLDRVSDTPFGRVEVSHVCLNDQVVEGLRCLDVPAFSVQYHPEAAAGPHDAGNLFDAFAELMRGEHHDQHGDRQGPADGRQGTEPSHAQA
jgi:carbamoyl-phosphate synthase small subunit